jgi:serine/threonine protein kinase
MTDIHSIYKISDKILGTGGAASIKKCSRIADGENCVIKELLDKNDKDKAERFKREIEVMNHCQSAGFHGIMPIYESNDEELWYIMPEAECLKDRLNLYADRQKNAIPIYTYRDGILEEFVNEFIFLATNLHTLHQNGYVHRDIKPHNIYYYNGHLYIGDFGIVDIPANQGKQLTKKGDRLGAWNTIAPEVLRDARNATPKSDVYSLAKTLWMCLALNLEGFDGRYDYSAVSMSLHDIPFLTGAYLLDIDELLLESTQEDPNLRPTMEEFSNKLKAWKELRDDFNTRCKKEWSFVYRAVFNNMKPPFMTLNDCSDIARALNILGRYTLLNYIILPSRGGLVLKGASVAPEEGCIYLDCDFCCVCHPKQLSFRGFSNDEEWNYFYLELDELTPILNNTIEEELIEDLPGSYVDPTYAAHGVYDYESGKPLPEGWKKVIRYTKGAFLIIPRSGFYNSITPVTDARHSICTEEQFYNYMLSIKHDHDYVLREEKDLGLVRSKYWHNPYKDSFEPLDLSSEPLVDQDFIRDHLDELNFSDLLDSSGEGAAVYAFTIHTSEGHSLFEPYRENYLCKDGFVRKLESNDNSIFLSHDREIAISLKDKFTRRLGEYCGAGVQGISPIDGFIDVEVRMAKIPEHLFSYGDIKQAIIGADDRIDNTLCIDENGHPVCVTPTLAHFYPVSYSKFPQLENFVGKYSGGSITDYIIKDMRSLWLEYLETGYESRYSEDYDPRDIKEILRLSKALLEDYRKGIKTPPLFGYSD